MRSMYVSLSFLVVVAVACGGDGDAIGPGSQTQTFPPETMGTGKPSDATSVTCMTADQCGYWYCRCDDGAVVNSALCTNGYCMGAASACPRACMYFNHGGWTGEAGGGPGSNPDPQPQTCGGLGSANVACDTCMKQSCCSEATVCGNSASCLSYWDCRVDCNGDSSCISECNDLYPTGQVPYENLADCLLDDCYSSCASGL